MTDKNKPNANITPSVVQGNQKKIKFTNVPNQDTMPEPININDIRESNTKANPNINANATSSVSGNANANEENKTKIDIAKFNKATIDRYNTLAREKAKEEMDLDSEKDDSEIAQSNDEDGIQKCNIKEIDAEEKDFNIVFPNFYQLDFFDHQQLLLLNKINSQGASETTTPSINPTPLDNKTKSGLKEVNATRLYQLFQNKHIQSFNQIDSFTTLLYLHKHEIHVANLLWHSHGKKKTSSMSIQGNHSTTADKQKIFIKKYPLTTEAHITEIENEMKIYFKLLNALSLKGNTNPYLCKIEGYYHDIKSKTFNVFYQYFNMTLYEKILSIDKTSNTNPNIVIDSFKEKVKIAKHLMTFLLILHANGVLHRDIKMASFFFEETSGCPKTFDLANAYVFPEGYDITKTTMMDTGDIKKEILTKTIFYTPRFVAPEITALNPTHGWAQDIWAFACFLIELFLDYSKYEDDQLTKLLNRIFRGEDYFISMETYTNQPIQLINNYTGSEENHNANSSNNKGDGKVIIPNKQTNQKKKYHIPKIPKCIEVNMAKIIANCFYIEPVNRPEISIIIEQFNTIILKKLDIKQIDLSKQEKEAINKLCRNCELMYNIQYNTKTEDNQSKWEVCQYHNTMIKHFYCEKCTDLICKNCCDMFHLNHPYENIGDVVAEFFISERMGLNAYQEELEGLEMDKNFEIIDNFSKVFEEDYVREKKKINDAYANFNNQINVLEQKQLNDLEHSRIQFEDMLRKVMADIAKVSKYSHSFNSTKNLFYSHMSRFALSLSKHEIDTSNYINSFVPKYKRFVQSANELLVNGEIVQDKIASLQIPGKYILKQEKYTDEMKNFLNGIETKIKIENIKNFDYSDSDSLSLSYELIMIIPLTNCVFSYFSNAFQKCKVNFEKFKVKINSFLPGCATLHLDSFFFISGGEIKDEPTSNFLKMAINEKEVSEGPEMNIPRRFHTMLSIKSKVAYFILAIGGWNSNEAEFIDISQMDSWINMPSMKFHRSDPTAYVLDNKFLYIFGGWDYTQKKCIGEVERYQLFNDEDDGSTISTNNLWETIVIKGETISLQKYNMGIISLIDKTTENSDKIILVGGFDESYDYSQSIIKIEIMKKDNSIFVNKDIKGLPTGGDSSFWYEKEFHLMKNEIDGEQIAVNFDCFNHLYVYTYRMNEFKQYGNSTAKN